MATVTTTGDGFNDFRKMLERAKDIPRNAIENAHRRLVSQMPDWTGALKEAIETKYGDGTASVFITVSGLTAKQPNQSSARVFLDLHDPTDDQLSLGGAGFAAEPYSIRIEEFGGPKSGLGRSAWADTEKFIEEQIKVELAAL